MQLLMENQLPSCLSFTVSCQVIPKIEFDILSLILVVFFTISLADIDTGVLDFVHVMTSSGSITYSIFFYFELIGIVGRYLKKTPFSQFTTVAVTALP